MDLRYIEIPISYTIQGRYERTFLIFPVPDSISDETEEEIRKLATMYTDLLFGEEDLIETQAQERRCREALSKSRQPEVIIGGLRSAVLTALPDHIAREHGKWSSKVNRIICTHKRTWIPNDLFLGVQVLFLFAILKI
jgi:hypothetical protein